LTQHELESRWTTAEGIPGVSYRFSDLVRIVSGDYAGLTAEVIALLALAPQPIYMVVLPPNEKSVVLAQSELEPTGSNDGRTLTLRSSERLLNSGLVTITVHRSLK
jgi:hypothetical protein